MRYLLKTSEGEFVPLSRPCLIEMLPEGNKLIAVEHTDPIDNECNRVISEGTEIFPSRLYRLRRKKDGYFKSIERRNGSERTSWSESPGKFYTSLDSLCDEVSKSWDGFFLRLGAIPTDEIVVFDNDIEVGTIQFSTQNSHAPDRRSTGN